MALIVIMALLLALVIQHKRHDVERKRHEAEDEKRFGADLAELRDLQGRELKRLETDYLTLRQELKGKNPDPRSDPRVKALEAEMTRVRSDFNENVVQLRASLTRLQAMGVPQTSAKPAATGRGTIR